MANIAHSIQQIEKLEDRARELQNMLDNVRARWDKHRQIADSSPEWEAHCEETGKYRFYNFGDVLA